MSRTTSTPAANAQSMKEGDAALDFERECVDFFADVVGVLGVPRSMGQIYGLLFSSPRPLSFTDIIEKLEISRGSASQGLQALRSLGAVRSVGCQDERRDLFEPELGLRKLVSGVLREKVEPLVSAGAFRLEKLKSHANAVAAPGSRRFSISRVQQIETWRRQMRLLLPLLKTILGKRA